MSIEYTVYCDGCGAILDASTISAGEARKVVKVQLGGLQRGSRDYCHDCVSGGKHKATSSETPNTGD